MLTSMEQGGKKQKPSPSPNPPLVMEKWIEIEEEVVGVEVEEDQTVQSKSEDPEENQGLSISQAQRVLMQSDFRRSPDESSSIKYSFKPKSAVLILKYMSYM